MTFDKRFSNPNSNLNSRYLPRNLVTLTESIALDHSAKLPSDERHLHYWIVVLITLKLKKRSDTPYFEYSVAHQYPLTNYVAEEAV